MAHHNHDESDSYYLDQICVIALAGAFGAVCLSLYFWQTAMLKRILADQFHQYILWSGIALTILVLIRAAWVWKSAGAQPAAAADSDSGSAAAHEHHHHDHEHAVRAQSLLTGVRATKGIGLGSELALAGAGDHHHHDHDHAHCGEHDHHEEGEDCCGEGHDHAHAHENAWTPLKCLVLLAPIVLYLMGLPSSIQSARDVSSKVDFVKEAKDLTLKYTRLLAAGSHPLLQVSLVGAAADDPTLGFDDPSQGEYMQIGFGELEGAAYDPERKAYWQGKVVKVRGQFFPNQSNDRLFTLARWRMSCCANDAVQLSVIMVSREPVTGVAPNDWVEVTGRVEFRKRPSGYGENTYLLLKGPESIQHTAPDSNPYLTAGQ